MKAVYILLTRTNTLPSRLIHAATGDGFTHVSIALDRHLSQLYSFARKHPRMPLPAGLVRESLHTAVYGRSPNCPSRLYEIEVTDAQHAAIQARIDGMIAAQEPWRYSILGMLLCGLNLAHRRQRHMFCAQFVASLLEDAGVLTLPRPASLMHPVDFIGIAGLDCRYEGPLSGCARWWRREDQEALYKARRIHVYSTGR